METPSSTTRRMTRSMTMAAAANGTTHLLSRKTDESEKTAAKLKQQQQQERNALIDITNDSPIIGLAMGSLRTPSSALSKKKRGAQFTARTPGSGEALLRGQVKTLLQKVEEEAELSKVIVQSRKFFSSPINLVAPTPANTPQIPNLSSLDEIVVQMMMSDEKKQEDRVIEADNVEITRSLLLDFSEKSSDLSDGSSVLTYQGALECRHTADEDDDAASVWSIQANASSTRDDDEYEDEGYDPVDVEEEDKEEEEDGPGEKNDDDDYSLDELCEGLSKVWMEDAGPRFMGKHTRIMYDDDGDEQQVFDCVESSGVLKLKGLPTPKGKHIRFP